MIITVYFNSGDSLSLEQVEYKGHISDLISVIADDKSVVRVKDNTANKWTYIRSSSIAYITVDN